MQGEWKNRYRASKPILTATKFPLRTGEGGKTRRREGEQASLQMFDI
jgi:hypothetical protein